MLVSLPFSIAQWRAKACTKYVLMRKVCPVSLSSGTLPTQTYMVVLGNDCWHRFQIGSKLRSPGWRSCVTFYLSPTQYFVFSRHTAPCHLPNIQADLHCAYIKTLWICVSRQDILGRDKTVIWPAVDKKWLFVLVILEHLAKTTSVHRIHLYLFSQEGLGVLVQAR